MSTSTEVEVYFEDTFYPKFSADLENARALVLIQSPFIGERRLDKIELLLQSCTRRKVRVCAFVQEPRLEADQHRFEAGVRRLTSLGVHVTTKHLIHEKLAVIDESILWDGSLNILSQDKSSERMTRWRDRDTVFRAVAKHGLNQ